MSNKNFAVVGYDKDYDVYDDLFLNTLEECKIFAETIKPICQEDRLLSSRRDPYDWLEIWDYNQEKKIKVIDLREGD